MVLRLLCHVARWGNAKTIYHKPPGGEQTYYLCCPADSAGIVNSVGCAQNKTVHYRASATHIMGTGKGREWGNAVSSGAELSRAKAGSGSDSWGCTEQWYISAALSEQRAITRQQIVVQQGEGSERAGLIDAATRCAKNSFGS